MSGLAASSVCVRGKVREKEVKERTHHVEGLVEVLILDTRWQQRALREVDRSGPLVGVMLQQPGNDWSGGVVSDMIRGNK